MSFLINVKISFLLGVLAMSTHVFAQEQVKPQVIKKVNFGYSKNPPARTKKDAENKKGDSAKKKDSAKGKKAKNSDKADEGSKQVAKKGSRKDSAEIVAKTDAKTPKEAEVASNDSAKNPLTLAGSKLGEVASGETRTDEVTIAKKTREIAKKASKESLLPTEIYNVGVEDVLFISLQYNGTGSSRYYTVLNDGTIDYPLAGELVSVVGLTTDEIEETLRSKVTLYENPEITVKVREHSSHKITVLGLVEKSGEKYLRREAMPLYVIRAEAIVKANATKVVLKREGQETSTLDLNDSKTGEVLIQTGDIIEFLGNENLMKAATVSGFYYIGQLVRQFGRRDFYEGLTLTQAILESGGVRNSKIKKVVIRRKNEEGLLKSETYKLKEIREGKTPDPVLQAGDTIEAAN